MSLLRIIFLYLTVLRFDCESVVTITFERFLFNFFFRANDFYFSPTIYIYKRKRRDAPGIVGSGRSFNLEKCLVYSIEQRVVILAFLRPQTHKSRRQDSI